MTSMFRLAAAATGLLSLTSIGPAIAQTQDLFRVATPAEVQAAPSERRGGRSGRGEGRERLVSLNTTALDDEADAGSKASKTRKLRIRLFPDADAEFERSSEDRGLGGSTIWSGDADDGSATLVMSKGKLRGRVQLKGRVYRIAPAGGSLYRIVEIDRGGLPRQGPERKAPVSKQGADAAGAERPTAEKATKSSTEITVLFAYTAKAARNSGDIDSDIDLAVALTNKAYQQSGVQITLKLAGTMLADGYDEAGLDFDRILDDVTDKVGPFAAVADRRDALKADLVSLIRDDKGEFCGLAWLNDKPSKGDAPYGISEVSVDCIESDTVAHELGHNMGLAHDRFVEDKTSNKKYNFGYVNVSKKVRDIMSYDNKCQSSDVPCKEISKFSSPDLKVKKQPFGIPKGKPGAADAVRRLNETREGVASFR